MGICNQTARLLLEAKAYGANYCHTMMIGRQNYFLGPQETAILGLPECVNSVYAEPFFIELGAQDAHSIDISSLELPTYRRDLSLPLDPYFWDQYTCVFDGGTLEHVFNTPQALLNCMRMLTLGGQFMSMTPINNMIGHGLYAFTPELFYRVFSPENGFKMRRCVVVSLNPLFTKTYLEDPKDLPRQQFASIFPLMLFVQAERVGDIPATLNIQQSMSTTPSGLTEPPGDGTPGSLARWAETRKYPRWKTWMLTHCPRTARALESLYWAIWSHCV
jgi:hypothetical protein